MKRRVVMGGHAMGWSLHSSLNAVWTPAFGQKLTFAALAPYASSSMENIVITAATPDEVRAGELGRQLRHYNYGFVGEYPEQQYIRLNARDGNGRLLGGLRSFVFLYWLNIDVLFVEADVRGAGLGSRLLAEAEQQAIELGATNAKIGRAHV